MLKPQFAILRFAKYKGPEISNIEAHNERTKENYASNPDIDKSRSHLNFHLIEPYPQRCIWTKPIPICTFLLSR